MTELLRCSCTRINTPWRRFCSGCGAGLGPACSCGFVNSKTDRFCGGCGVAVARGDAAALDAATVRAKPIRPVPSKTDEITMPIEILNEVLSAE